MPQRIASSLSVDLGSLAARLVLAASPAVLASATACGGTAAAGHTAPLTDAATSTGGLTGSGGSTGTGGAPVGTGGMAPVFPTLSVTDGGYPSCTGTGMPGLYGPCCTSVHCIEPPDAGVECPPASAIAYQSLGYPSLGSGNCMCGGSIEGPFVASSAQQYSTTQGPCCYTIGVMGCTGRPLVIAGKPRLAPLVRGAAWV